MLSTEPFADTAILLGVLFLMDSAFFAISIFKRKKNIRFQEASKPELIADIVSPNRAG